MSYSSRPKISTFWYICEKAFYVNILQINVQDCSPVFHRLKYKTLKLFKKLEDELDKNPSLRRLVYNRSLRSVGVIYCLNRRIYYVCYYNILFVWRNFWTSWEWGASLVLRKCQQPSQSLWGKTIKRSIPMFKNKKYQEIESNVDEWL